MSETSGPTSVGRGPGAEEATRLLEKNRRWADARLAEDPEVFARLGKGQHPPFLFIGCCDSRKPIDTITGTRPGELFIHRNIANLLLPGDPAAGAALEFAIDTLGVRHLIVCGHTRCGGMTAALAGLEEGEVGRWLASVRALAADHRDELAHIREAVGREDRLAALNVVAQLGNALRNPAVAGRLRKEGPPLHLHGWIFQVETGRLEALPLPVRQWREQGLLPSGTVGPKASMGNMTGG